MKGFIEKYIPSRTHIPLAFCFSFQMLAYYGTKQVTKNWRHYDLSIALDDKIPFLPVFISVYILSFAYWAVSYVLITRSSRERCRELVTTDIIVKLVGLVCFIALPTYIYRPQILGSDIFSRLTAIIYASDTPVNLFPSMHCTFSWLCWRPLHLCPEIPRWYRVAALVLTLLIMASTVLTKQHYFVDIPAGVILAEAAYQIGYKWRPLKRVYG